MSNQQDSAPQFDWSQLTSSSALGSEKRPEPEKRLDAAECCLCGIPLLVGSPGTVTIGGDLIGRSPKATGYYCGECGRPCCPAHSVAIQYIFPGQVVGGGLICRTCRQARSLTVGLGIAFMFTGMLVLITIGNHFHLL